MTVILVLATFIIFLLIDYLYSRRRAVQPAVELVPEAIPAPRLQPGLVAGFKLPDNLRYHPGHTWALQESPNLVRVGMDDFAGRLVGKIERILLPQRGQWIRQGQKICTMQRDDSKVEMVSPIEGIVNAVNEAVAEDAELARRDPYGEGWLVTVQSPDAKINFRNLLGGAVARKWMEEAAARLRLRMRMTTMTGVLAQDGGVAIDDVSTHLPKEIWTELAREFFLS